MTPDHTTPHSINPAADPTDPLQWQTLCGRHQVIKKNFWDGATGKMKILAILHAASIGHKHEVPSFLKQFSVAEISRADETEDS